MRRTHVVIAVLALSAAAAVSAQRLAFTPPRLLTADLTPLPAPTIIGGGEVLTAMAIAPSTIQFTASNAIVKEKTGSFAVIEITELAGTITRHQSCSIR